MNVLCCFLCLLEAWSCLHDRPMCYVVGFSAQIALPLNKFKARIAHEVGQIRMRFADFVLQHLFVLHVFHETKRSKNTSKFLQRPRVDLIRKPTCNSRPTISYTGGYFHILLFWIWPCQRSMIFMKSVGKTYGFGSLVFFTVSKTLFGCRYCYTSLFVFKYPLCNKQNGVEPIIDVSEHLVFCTGQAFFKFAAQHDWVLPALKRFYFLLWNNWLKLFQLDVCVTADRVSLSDSEQAAWVSYPSTSLLYVIIRRYTRKGSHREIFVYCRNGKYLFYRCRENRT